MPAWIRTPADSKEKVAASGSRRSHQDKRHAGTGSRVWMFESNRERHMLGGECIHIHGPTNKHGLPQNKRKGIVCNSNKRLKETSIR